MSVGNLGITGITGCTACTIPVSFSPSGTVGGVRPPVNATSSTIFITLGCLFLAIKFEISMVPLTAPYVGKTNLAAVSSPLINLSRTDVFGGGGAPPVTASGALSPPPKVSSGLPPPNSPPAAAPDTASESP